MKVKKKQSYIVVLDWMVEKYHLKGNELLAYALIYGFSQDEESEYKGSYTYICKWLSIDRATAIRILSRLESKGLLTKRQELVSGKATNRYAAETPEVESATSSQTSPAGLEPQASPRPPDPSQNATGGEMRPVAKCHQYPSQNATNTRRKMPPSNTKGKPIGEIYLSARDADPDGLMDESTDFDALRERFRKQLKTDTLAEQYDPQELEEILDAVVELYSCPYEHQQVGQQVQSTASIRKVLDAYESRHVEYVMESLHNTTRPIKNIRSYLRVTILRAPTTIRHYYKAQSQAAEASAQQAPPNDLMKRAAQRMKLKRGDSA